MSGDSPTLDFGPDSGPHSGPGSHDLNAMSRRGTSATPSNVSGTGFHSAPGAGSESLGQVPASIGPYALSKLLGEGGFGLVYLANQQNPSRSVAIKVLKPGVTSRATLTRFALEATTLGRLSHPGIAQVFDAGFFDPRTGEIQRQQFLSGAFPGTPFFAMELVEGLPATTFAKQRGLDLYQRVELFIRIAEAVQHAHTRGVIHRDLKPANILITATGEPKILDFGVARVIDTTAPAATLATHVGQIVGTLAYMSPEQVWGDSGEIDPRSDVYSLGIILHELLAGSLPFNITDRQIIDATRIILQEDPPRLGTISPDLRGDLETITLKSLEKDKARRYQSAEDLAADLRRYLNHEPISARPPTTLYRIGKFSRRHRALVVGVSAAFILLAAGAGATAVQAVRASRAEKLASKERDAARTEAAKVKATLIFFERMLTAADPDKKGRDVRLIDMLDSTAAEIPTELKAQPEVAATLHNALAGAYRTLGELDVAQVQANAAIEKLTNTIGPTAVDTLVAKQTLARVYIEQSKFEDAERTLLEVEKHASDPSCPDQDLILDCWADLASAYSAQGKLALSAGAAEKAHKAYSARTGKTSAATMTAQLQLAQIYAAMERTEEAEPMLKEVLEYRVKHYPAGDLRITRARQPLGELYRMQGKYKDATEMHRQTVEDYTTRFGVEHPQTLVRINNYAKSLQQANQLDEAERVLTTNLERLTKISGPDHFDTLTAAGFLSDVCHAKGDPRRAADLRAKVVKGRIATLGPDHPQTLVAQTNQAYALTDAGDIAAALAIYTDLLAKREKALGPDHAEVALTCSLIGYTHMKGNNPSAAEPAFRRALAIREKILPIGSGLRGITMSGLGYTLLQLHKKAPSPAKLEESRTLLLTGAEWVLADPKSPPRNRKDVCDRAAEYFESQNDPVQAKAWRDKGK
ncbi:MAG: serine/threonine-protein kinase [Planctomycetes bacterium]|nr:serine/threonine-protein kinase [Planctomycetota bacterium]